jgi:hypothetical protein
MDEIRKLIVIVECDHPNNGRVSPLVGKCLPPDPYRGVWYIEEPEWGYRCELRRPGWGKEAARRRAGATG